MFKLGTSEAGTGTKDHIPTVQFEGGLGSAHQWLPATMFLFISFYLAFNYLRKSAHKNQRYRHSKHTKDSWGEITVFVFLELFIFALSLWKIGSGKCAYLSNFASAHLH